jgi:DNA-binding response OmpR family regulator
VRTEEPCILVVDDEPDLLENIGMALEAEGYRVLTALDGVQALAILEEQSVNLVLADIAMPKMNGYQLYERIRQNTRWTSIPFIFLSARRLDSDIRYGKELGVDDYLIKPIHSADLLAAIRGKLRRAEQLAHVLPQVQVVPAPSPLFPISPRLRIDQEQHRVWFDAQEVRLSAKEFIILEHLAHQQGKVISMPELVHLTHRLDVDSTEAGTLLRPLIRSLRRKLGIPIGETGCIENVRGLGYRLVL